MLWHDFVAEQPGFLALWTSSYLKLVIYDITPVT